MPYDQNLYWSAMLRRREISTAASMDNMDSLVTPLGYRQIEALSRRFQDIPVDAVYSSDLYRTRMTAKAIYAPKGLPLHLEPGLREIAMGPLEDQTWGGAARRDRNG